MVLYLHSWTSTATIKKVEIEPLSSKKVVRIIEIEQLIYAHNAGTRQRVQKEKRYNC